MTKFSKNNVVAKKEDTGTISVKVTKVFKHDTEQTTALIRAGRKAAAQAIRTSKALGLTITFMKDGVLYRENPDGTKEIISTKTKIKNNKNILKKGMVLHAKK